MPTLLQAHQTIQFRVGSFAKNLGLVGATKKGRASAFRDGRGSEYQPFPILIIAKIEIAGYSRGKEDGSESLVSFPRFYRDFIFKESRI